IKGRTAEERTGTTEAVWKTFGRTVEGARASRTETSANRPNDRAAGETAFRRAERSRAGFDLQADRRETKGARENFEGLVKVGEGRRAAVPKAKLETATCRLSQLSLQMASLCVVSRATPMKTNLRSFL